MFTGIIEAIGKLRGNKGSAYEFTTPPTFYRKLRTGISVAVNGVCLTVVKKSPPNVFAAELMPETEKRTVFGTLQANDMVNLELPATSDTFLSGHIVQGHVDGVGEIVSIQNDGNSKLITIELQPSLTRYIVEKGTIALNGISLTIIQKGKDFFTVGIIPFTWKNTTIKNVKVGDRVNIEVDAIGKYVYGLLKEVKYDTTKRTL